MRRSLLIGIAVLAVLLLFTGCDAILEVFYPELVEGQGGYGEYTIHLDLELDYGVSSLPEWADGLQPIRIWAIPYYYQYDPATGSEFLSMAPPNEFKQQERWPSTDQFDMFAADFFPLKETSYRVIVWLDRNNNSVPDYDEPSRLATMWDPYGWETDWFDFTLSDTPNKVDSWMWLNKWDRAPEDVLIALGAGGTFTDLSFHLQGSPVMDTSFLGTFWYQVSFHQPSPSWSQIKWWLRDQDWNYYYVDSVIEHTVYGPADFGVNFGTAQNESTSGGILENVEYVLEVEVTYTSGEIWWQNYSVKAIDEAAPGSAYDLYVNVSGLTNDPVRLDWGSYNFQIATVNSYSSLFDNWSDLYGETWFDPEPSLGATVISGGGVNNAHVGPGTLAYNTAPGLRAVWIVVDANRDGIYGNVDDWMSFKRPVIVKQGDLVWDGAMEKANLNMYFNAGDFFRVKAPM